jgi:U6 snRNA-associated Sm-like protein LSm1
MENLSLTDTPPPGPAVGLNLPPPQQPQLPPQMFTTAAQLLDLTDSKKALLKFSLKDLITRMRRHLPWTATPFYHKSTP